MESRQEVQQMKSFKTTVLPVHLLVMPQESGIMHRWQSQPQKTLLQ